MNSLFVTAALFFQLWMPIWEARPFVVSDFTYKSRTVMDEKMLTPISETLKYADARLRGELYVALAAAPIRGNQQFLLEKCLPAEKDELLRATILRQLAVDSRRGDCAIPQGRLCACGAGGHPALWHPA